MPCVDQIFTKFLFPGHPGSQLGHWISHIRLAIITRASSCFPLGALSLFFPSPTCSCRCPFSIPHWTSAPLDCDFLWTADKCHRRLPNIIESSVTVACHAPEMAVSGLRVCCCSAAPTPALWARHRLRRAETEHTEKARVAPGAGFSIYRRLWEYPCPFPPQPPGTQYR